ncbi:MAG: hypothetical protein QM775_11295 [Pirellulales bacterium]
MALADVYDALTSRRCYKEPFVHAVARSIIVGDAGKHFDPDVVEAFLRVEDEFVAVYNRFREPDEAEMKPASKPRNAQLTT